MQPNWDQAWKRAMECDNGRGHPLVRGKQKSDFRSIYFTQKFENLAIGATSNNQNQTFPEGAFILGITGAAILPRIAHADQYYADAGVAPLDSTWDRLVSNTPGNLDCFSVSLQYTNDEVIVPQGPCLAAALFGIQGNSFPVREIIIHPSQALLASVKNEISVLGINGLAAATGITMSINVHLSYYCMVPRAAG